MSDNTLGPHGLSLLDRDDLIELIAALRHDCGLAHEALMAAYVTLEQPQPAPNGDYTIVPLLVASVMAERRQLRMVVGALRLLVEQAGPWPDADMGVPAYNRLMAELTHLDYCYGGHSADRRGTVEIGGQVMTQAQYDAARFPLVAELDRLRERLEAERRHRIRAVDEEVRLRAVVDVVLVWLREMTDNACEVDVLRVADLYRTVTAQLDPTIGDDS